jgi:hypothetical protein
MQFESQFVRQLGEYTSEYKDDESYLQMDSFAEESKE